MRRIAAWAFSGPALLHESLHYLAARILGVEAVLVVRPEERQAYTRVTAAKPWQDLLITLAPAACGLLLSPLVLTQAAAENTPAKVLLLSAWIFWMAACWQDYVDAWSVLRQKP